jgi:hypothetical protein
MAVQVKNAEVLGILRGLAALGSSQMTPVGAVKFLKIHRALRQHHEDVDSVRQDLAKQYAVLDEQGDAQTMETEQGTVSYVMDPEKEADFTLAIRALYDEVFEVRHTLSASDFAGTVTPAALAPIEAIIE